MDVEYFIDVKEYIKGMNEEEFTKRGTTKKAVLKDQDIMENIWYDYQKNVEEYGCDKESSLKDVVKKALDVLPPKAPALYRCSFCGSERFTGHQFIRADVYVDGDGEFDGSLSGSLEELFYGVRDSYGPFTCVKCSQEFDELPDNEQVKLSKGTFPVVYGKTVQKFKEAGCEYSYEDNGYTVVNNGERSIAVSNFDYNRYYDN